MKLTIILLVAFSFSTLGKGLSQEISLSFKNASLEKVMHEVRKQSGYAFIFNAADLKHAKGAKITTDLNKASIQQALLAIFDELPYSYEVKEKSIVLKLKKQGTAHQQVNEKIDPSLAIQGKVVDSLGRPLVGASIRVKGTKLATTTNHQGEFRLHDVADDAVLVISFVGYTSREIPVRAEIGTIVLHLTKSDLDEVMINAGYYTVKDRERTGSISKITSKEISQQPVANPLAAMQGRMAGVHITQNSGTPGGGFDIQIRGRNSLRTEGNDPLYIINGVPYSSKSTSDQALSGLLFSMGNVSPLNSINPNDIESIEVLKDADATAIYGSRGSNGVVLITTKSGTSDKTTFSMQSTTSVSTLSKSLDLMNTEEYLKMRMDAFANDGITTYPSNAYDVNGTWDQNRYTNWQQEFFGRKPVSQNAQFSIGGGSGRTSFLLNASHRYEQTTFVEKFGYKRSSFSFNLRHESKNKRFEVQMSVMKSGQNNHQMATDSFGKIFLAPNSPTLYTEDGDLNWEKNTFDNPLASLNSQYFSKVSDFTSQVDLSYKLHSDFKIRLSAGAIQQQNIENKTLPHTIYNPSYGLTSEFSSNSTTTLKRNNWIIEPKIEWLKQKKVGKWSALIGATFESRNQDIFSLTASDFLSNDFIFNMANGKNTQIKNDSEIVYKYTAVYGRLNYTVSDKYLINLTGRRDGSSRFGPNNRFANFGAVGAAWLFSREKLFEASSWLSFGKIRASYGIAGSDLIGDYQYLNTFIVSSQRYDGKVILDPFKLYNADFSWESNKKMEVAMELEFFNGSLSSTISYYRNRSSNQLVGIPLSAVTGFNSVQANLNATVQNTGYESTLKSVNFSNNKFSWTSELNFSIPRNKLISFPNLEESSYANSYVVGMPITIKKVYNYLGVNKLSGLYEFEDTNQDGRINAEDKNTVANIGIKYFGGLNNHFNYKKFSIDFLLQFVKQSNYNYDYYFPSSGDMSNRQRWALNYFSLDNPDAKYQKPSTGVNNLAVQAANNFKESNAVIEDASFFRFKTIQLAYVLPNIFNQNNTLSIYFQGNNLFTISNFIGSDPEAKGVLLPGLKTFSFGFNFKF
ncbi:SusC/RagA family TonB-linked outer membrane protein [Sphingobacterium faecale]|uniref:SusC/RagA family TonB-linked outer membrane protein n=1 Tax=Sphingobacterium faecale TaxID=2803775 RepID=A0ABS1R672_9SPHI|nr:SusC/RagA family TonB-linked outer membrane protein [Sphingobacterium faecale]MBL1410210.1 SusC/RagA family TonB-linked outer membrane protein [Sphingobacterium faecale]